jgi:hypothetical protein
VYQSRVVHVIKSTIEMRSVPERAHSGPCVAGIPLLFSVPALGSAPSARIET